MARIDFKEEDVRNLVDARQELLVAAQQLRAAEDAVRVASRDFEQAQSLYNAIAKLHNRELEWLKSAYDVPETYSVECQLGADGKADVFAISPEGDVAPINRHRKKR